MFLSPCWQSEFDLGSHCKNLYRSVPVVGGRFFFSVDPHAVVTWAGDGSKKRGSRDPVYGLWIGDLLLFLCTISV